MRSIREDHQTSACQSYRIAADYKPSCSIAMVEHPGAAVVEEDSIEEVDDWEVHHALGMEETLQMVHNDPATGNKDSVDLEGRASQLATVHAVPARATAHLDLSHAGPPKSRQPQGSVLP